MDIEIEVSLETIITLFLSLKSAVDYAYDDSPEASAQKENLSSTDFLNRLIYNCHTHVQEMSSEKYSRLVETLVELNVKLETIKHSGASGVTGEATADDT